MGSLSYAVAICTLVLAATCINLQPSAQPKQRLLQRRQSCEEQCEIEAKGERQECEQNAWSFIACCISAMVRSLSYAVAICTLVLAATCINLQPSASHERRTEK